MVTNVIEKPTIAERDYACDLDDRFNLGLHFDFLDDRKKVKKLIHGFGFHKHLDINQRKYTGIHVEETLRNGIENGLTYAEIQNRLNNRVDDIEYDKGDVEFLVEILTNSKNPPRFEDSFKSNAQIDDEAFSAIENEFYDS